MAGNVWEWTRSLWGKEWNGDKLDFKYPYQPGDGREDLKANEEIYRVVRGSSFIGVYRCAYRESYLPHFTHSSVGFRVAMSPF
jgi:iron(II)-dependent oxidoreductase